MSKYLVTGGAGFIGSHIVETLLEKGEKVRILDNFSTGRKENLKNLPEKYELIEGDLRNPEDMGKAVQGVEVIFHEAALPSVPRSIADPIISNEVNITGTLNLLWAAKNAHVKRIVFASSSSVYGDAEISPKHEELSLNPLSPYAATKALGEYYMKIWNNLYGLETVCLRYFNVFGPRQNPESQYAAVVPIFMTQLLKGKSCHIYGDGKQARDFTYVANVVEANLLAAKCHEAAGKIFNIACGDSILVNTLYQQIASLAGSSLKPEHVPPRPGEIKNSKADISLAETILGYKPKVDFRRGLEKTWEYFKNM